MDVLIERYVGLDAHHWAIAGCLRPADGWESRWLATAICGRAPNGPLTTLSPSRPFSGACATLAASARRLRLVSPFDSPSARSRGGPFRAEIGRLGSRSTNTPELRANLVRPWLEVGTLEMLLGFGFRSLANGVLLD